MIHCPKAAAQRRQAMVNKRIVIDAIKLAELYFGYRHRRVVKDQGFLIDGGYGKIKGTTFRISSMGDETEGTMKQLYAALDAAMNQV